MQRKKRRLLSSGAATLETEAERETYRHTNVRKQFLRNINKKFQYQIKQRELVNGTTFPPSELFRMHLAFEQSENENKTTFINKISTDIDLQQAFPSTHIKKQRTHKKEEIDIRRNNKIPLTQMKSVEVNKQIGILIKLK